MNLKPCNAICKSLTGETNTLPSATALGNLFLDQDEMLATSSEDIKCFFYLFKVPDIGWGTWVSGSFSPRRFWMRQLMGKGGTWLAGYSPWGS